jgi:type II secretory pathway pseudopilin PulG
MHYDGRGSASNVRGFSLVQLLIAVVIILIIAALAIPRFLHSTIAANEYSAVNGFRVIIDAEQAYKEKYGVYADSLAKLGPAASSGGRRVAGATLQAPTQARNESQQVADPAAANLIEGRLALADPAHGRGRDGYFTDLRGRPNGYEVWATPMSPSTGRRSFCMDETGIIRFTVGQACEPGKSPPLQ